MRELDWRELRRRIGVVLQAPYLFDDRSPRNIALGEDCRTWRSCSGLRRSQTRRFIESMALAYETKVGESGIRLSGGQAQRVASPEPSTRPPVLILDEATSALDSESEGVVKRNLDRMLEVARRSSSPTASARSATPT